MTPCFISKKIYDRLKVTCGIIVKFCCSKLYMMKHCLIVIDWTSPSFIYIYRETYILLLRFKPIKEDTSTTLKDV